MAGIFGPGECIDAGIRGITSLLDSSTQILNPGIFINPQAQNIINMAQGSTSVKDGLLIFLAGPPVVADPGLGAALDRFNDAKAVFELWTNFLSGKSHTFPNEELDVLFHRLGRHGDLPAQLPLLAGMGFVGLMGVVSGATQIAYAKCEVNPEDPCAAINKVFGAIMGVVNTIINTILQGFAIMNDFINKIMEYIDMINEFIDKIIGAVLEAINALVNAVMAGIRYALAKLLKALGNNPCMMAVLKEIAGPELQQTLGLE